MVCSCVAFGCANRATKTSGITFHLFPKDEALRSAWERAVKRHNWKLKDGDRPCSAHFEAECFDRTVQTTRLRIGSVPTLFPAFPAHLQQPQKRKREPPRPRTVAPLDNCAEPEVEEDPEPASPTQVFYKQKAAESEDQVQQLKKKVKTLQQTRRRLTKRYDASKELLKELKGKQLLSEKGLEVFESTFSPDIHQLLCRSVEKEKIQYPPELRTLALTLHFYSPAAYEYVRAKFNNALPSQRTLRE
ncbi:THAP domain-containing protein 1-like [Haemaphysalis longicornis]